MGFLYIVSSRSTCISTWFFFARLVEGHVPKYHLYQWSLTFLHIRAYIMMPVYIYSHVSHERSKQKVNTNKHMDVSSKSCVNKKGYWIAERLSISIYYRLWNNNLKENITVAYYYKLLNLHFENKMSRSVSMMLLPKASDNSHEKSVLLDIIYLTNENKSDWWLWNVKICHLPEIYGLMGVLCIYCVSKILNFYTR